MGLLLATKKSKDLSKKSSKVNKQKSVSIKEGFKILTKQEVEAERSVAYEYVL